MFNQDNYFSLGNTQITLKVGDEETINVYGEYSADSIDWSSSDRQVVSVSKGKIKALKSGVAYITAQMKGVVAVCIVYVNEPEPTVSMPNLSFSNTSIWIHKGESVDLGLTITPETVDTRGVVFDVSDDSTIFVDENASVISLNTGKAVVTAKLNGSVATCVVNVLPEVDENNVYQISDLTDLKLFRDYVNAGYTDADAILLNNIIINDDSNWLDWDANTTNIIDWEPIGKNEELAYTGFFDGNGYKIRGVYSGGRSEYKNYGWDYYTYSGLFGIIGAGGVVCHLGVESGVIFTKNGEKCYAGAISGISDGGLIQDCYSSAKIMVINDDNENAYVGGICGDNDGTIERCCTTDISSITVEGYNTYVGGIVGSGSNISECYNSADIMVTGRYNRIGGIAGSGSYITASYNRGSLQAYYSYSSLLETYMGGISGFYWASTDTIYNCYNIGLLDVEHVSGADTDVGSITGYNSNYYSSKYETSYYLKGIQEYSVGRFGGVGNEVSLSTMLDSTFLGKINKGLERMVWVQDYMNENNGIPVLWWQNTTYWNE